MWTIVSMCPALKADPSVFFFLEGERGNRKNTGRHQNNEMNAGNRNAQGL